MGGPAANVGIVDMSAINSVPSGRDGRVNVRDGHFVDGAGRPIRFLGTNLTFGEAFPTHEEAEALATRLASIGLNAVRIHHIDLNPAPSGIWKPGRPLLNELDPDQIDRLDYLFSQLKAHGLYVDLNLHVSRRYWLGHDFPDGLKNAEERNQRLPHYAKGLDKVNPTMLAMQRDYARDILTHVNPYTKLRWADDPVIALVEINNENTLLNLDADSLPDYYKTDIVRLWNDWLRERYPTTAALAEVWGTSIPLGEEKIVAPATPEGPQYLRLVPDGANAVRVELVQSPSAGWMAQTQWRGLTLAPGALHTLSFEIRSDKKRRINYSARHTRPDWENLGLGGSVSATPEWTTHTITFTAGPAPAGEARIDFINQGSVPGWFELRNVSLREGGENGLRPGESLENGTVGIDRQKAVATVRGNHWRRFLAETERAYGAAMRALIRDEIGCKAPLIDTQADWGGLLGIVRECGQDFIDTHCYWQHPNFPGIPWDRNNWSVGNRGMSDEPKNGSKLGALARVRVDGKPFTVTEYDHPAPNSHVAEMFPMVASWAAAQDWDGIFQFDWGSHKTGADHTENFFSLQANPAKLAFLPAAAAMFRMGAVPPLPSTATLEVADVLQRAERGASHSGLWSDAGLDAQEPIERRIAMRFLDMGKLANVPPPPRIVRNGPEPRPGTSPIVWREGEPYRVDAPGAKVAAGACGGRTLHWEGLTATFGGKKDAFAAFALTAMDASPLRRSRRILLTTLGAAENTDMGWNEAHTSVGTKWGHAPTRCEGITASVSVSLDPGPWKIWALDGKGHPQAEVPATYDSAASTLSFEVSPKHRTVWYEITRE